MKRILCLIPAACWLGIIAALWTEVIAMSALAQQYPGGISPSGVQGGYFDKNAINQGYFGEASTPAQADRGNSDQSYDDFSQLDKLKTGQEQSSSSSSQ